MNKKQCIAMLLAGGQGSRLGILTRDTAKPAIPFGGKYRLIDFPLSNCANSDIDVVGVLTQYQPLELNSYIGSGMPWDLDRLTGGAFILPPYVKGKAGTWYKGSANAVYQNIAFINQFDPDYVLVLGGDHVYKMDYSLLIEAHRRNMADLTVCGIEVPWEEAPRFGVMITGDGDVITEFEEKPKNPRSNLASMGIYVFNWPMLRRYLEEDERTPKSSGDFGKDIIPRTLVDGMRLFAYRFNGYWKDVGTVESLWEANMDLLGTPPVCDLNDRKLRIYSRNMGMPPHYIGKNASVSNSLVPEGCSIYGDVSHSVLFTGVQVDEGATVADSVVMPGAVIHKGARVQRAIIAENAVIGEGCRVGGDGDIAVVGFGAQLPPNHTVACGEQFNEVVKS